MKFWFNDNTSRAVRICGHGNLGLTPKVPLAGGLGCGLVNG